MTVIRHQVLHSLGVLKAASAADLARRTSLADAEVMAVLNWAETSGRAARVGTRWTLTPLARLELGADYSRVHAETRSNADFIAANGDFERINTALKTLITDWQLVTIAGQPVANDHSDAGHDARIIDRLAALHDRAEPVLARLAAVVPALGFYRSALLAALERAEDGEIGWVSDATCESYHTLWFELHEELLRILGGTRAD